MKTKITLTDDQKNKIVEEWNRRKTNPPSLKELILLIFGVDNLDGRSAEGIAIKELLVEKSLNKPEKRDPELSEENKEFIRNNSDSMSATEMSRIIFNSPKLMTGNPETRMVIAYKATLGDALMYKNEKLLKEFKPPRKDEQVIKIVNDIAINAFDPDKIDGAAKKCLTACITYMSNERFLTEIESYTEPNERKMFINNFIRHIYDKPDLTQQDLDTLILYAKEIIEHGRLEAQMSYLRGKQDNDDNDSKMSMALVEAMDKTTTNLSQSKKTQQSLIKEINEKRSDRLKKERSTQNSLINLIADWKEEESRLKIIKLAMDRKAILGEEIDKLSELDEFKARIFGLNKEELLYG